MSAKSQKLLTDFFRLAPGNENEPGPEPAPCASSAPCFSLTDSDVADDEARKSPSSTGVSTRQSRTTGDTAKVIRTVLLPSGKENRKRRRALLDDPKQMILDAGQKRIGHQHCRECGMVYDCDSPSDQRQHKKFHNRFQSTEWFRVQTAQLEVWKRSTFCIVEQIKGNYSYTFCIKQTSKCSLKNRIDKIILECVNKELGFAPDLAQIWTTDGRRQAWIYVTAAADYSYYFVGAIVLVEKVLREQLYPSEINNLTAESSNDRLPYMGVNRIWVHQSLRRKGIAGFLLDRARTFFTGTGIIPHERLAFSSLTDSGRAFAERYVPGGEVLLYRLVFESSQKRSSIPHLPSTATLRGITLK